MRSKTILILSILALFIFSQSAFSQTENATISDQFDDLIENSETFKTYKVIPITRINSLFSAVKDSLNAPKAQINSLNERVGQQLNEIADLKERNETVTADLEQSKLLNDGISFLGLDFQKSVYNILVWGIIVALIVVVVLIYLMFQRSNRVTNNARKELSALASEFDDHKAKSHEKQVKLKRDLQTAWNALNENGIRV